MEKTPSRCQSPTSTAYAFTLAQSPWPPTTNGPTTTSPHTHPSNTQLVVSDNSEYLGTFTFNSKNAATIGPHNFFLLLLFSMLIFIFYIIPRHPPLTLPFTSLNLVAPVYPSMRPYPINSLQMNTYSYFLLRRVSL